LAMLPMQTLPQHPASSRWTQQSGEHTSTCSAFSTSACNSSSLTSICRSRIAWSSAMHPQQHARPLVVGESIVSSHV
jgi:hypothetical protein